MLDIDEIRKTVAIEHGFLLDKDDPVLASVTINRLLLEKAVATLNSQNIEHQKKTVEAVVAVMAESLAKEKETAGRVITDGTDYVTDQVKLAVVGTMDESTKKLVKTLSAALVEVRNAKKAAFMWAGVSGICLTLSGLVLLSLIKHL